MPVDKSDPIDVAMNDRKTVGGAPDSVISIADAKKARLQIPQPITLSIDKPKEAVISFLTDEMIANAEESKGGAAAASGSSAKPGKSKAAAETFDSDPIAYTIAQRMTAGGLTEHKTKQDAAKEKLSTSSAPNLALPNQKDNF